MDVLIETFPSQAAAAMRKAQLAGQWDVAAEGAIAAADDFIFRVWGIGNPPPKTSEQALDPGDSKYAVLFKPKAAGGS